MYCDEPYIAIRWESEGPWVIVEWKAWATSQEHRAAYEKGLLAVTDNHATMWLVDARAMRAVVAEDQHWLATYFVPRLARAGIRKTALVRPKSEVAALASDNVVRDHPIDADQRRSFTTLDEAKAWLRSV